MPRKIDNDHQLRRAPHSTKKVKRGRQVELKSAVKVSDPVMLSEMLASIANDERLEADIQLLPGTYVITAIVDVKSL